MEMRPLIERSVTCQDNNLSLNLSKSKELIVQEAEEAEGTCPNPHRRDCSRESNRLSSLAATWSAMPPRGSLQILPLQHREPPDPLHHGLVQESLSQRQQGPPVHHWGHVHSHPGHLLEMVLEEVPQHHQGPHTPQPRVVHSLIVGQTGSEHEV